MDSEETRKPHRKKQAGSKLNKKSKKEFDSTAAKPKNPKAFTFNSIKKTERAVRRSADVKERKFHQPLVDRTSVVPPPVVVAVVGPPKVGKSTLITCLIRNFVRKKVTNINGPISIVTSKKQRLTFIECNNDINSMIDIAKIADLVLLMVDASFGFEMEIFEFLHIAKSHGEMKVLGVLSHLDSFDRNKKLKKTKKILKDRFWKDVYPGAKLFYLSGIINTSYMKSEVKNLGRFITVIKYRPLIWRSSHPYILVDRMEDITDPEEVRQCVKVDRSVCFYGYVRGTHFKNKSVVHIPGVGDHIVTEMSALEDPCPLPDQLKKRSLNEQERLLYAPMCEVGGVMIDQDAIYINTAVNQAFSHQHHRSKDVTEMMESMMAVKGALNDKLNSAQLQVFSKEREKDGEEEDDDNDDEAEESDDNDEEKMDVDEDGKEKPWGKMSLGSDDDDEEDEDDDDEEDEDDDEEEDEDDGENEDDDDDDDEEDEEDIDGEVRWKTNLREKGIRGFLKRLNNHNNMQQLVYGDNAKRLEEDKGDDKDEEEVFGFLKSVNKAKSGFETSRKHARNSMQTNVKEFDEDAILEEIERIRDLMTTGEWKEDEDAAKLLKKDDANRMANEEDDDDDDDFNDDDDDDDNGKDGSEGDDDDDEEDEEHVKETLEERRERRMKAKLLTRKTRQRELFEAINGVDTNEKTYFEQQKEEFSKLAELNRSEFDSVSQSQRVAFEGYRPGTYVRIQINNFPCEFVTNFDPSYPLILGGLLASEQNIGLVTVTMKVHRWYKRILKSGDPLVLSIGWRRFQTIPTFSIADHNGRNRFCKYTPPHYHCQATFWGPITPDKTGVVAVQTLSSETKDFRLAGMGVVSQSDNAISIVKKLKLVGHPFLVHRNTAFIKGMFNSELEVAKFTNASLRTVSGVRGQVKKSVKAASTIVKKHKVDTAVPHGSFRATFEDKILMKDIVFMRTWCKTIISQFYNPVSNLLLPKETRDAWKGMRTGGEVRRERNIRRTPQEDSFYKPITRTHKEETPLHIPNALQKNLPFKFKPKTQARTIDTVKRVAIVKDPKERKVSEMMKRMQDLYKAKNQARRTEMRQRAVKHQDSKRKEEAKKKNKKR